MSNARDDGLGCKAFGHLAGPFVDAELARAEMDRFEVHLGGCEDCRRLTDDFRTLDEGMRSEVQLPQAADWSKTWDGIEQTIQADRSAAEHAPLAPVSRAADRFLGGPMPARWKPVLYLAASLLLLLGLRLARDASLPPELNAPGAGVEITSLECEEDGFVPMTYTIGGDDPIVVAQCVFIGTSFPEGS
jgi:hypothetical protein